MLKIKKSQDRGYNKIDWLESYHSFSFGSYYNPLAMSYGPLRVINEDFIESHKGFGFHPHKNMEIVTFMLDGKIQHRDNMDNTSVLSKGNAQLMRAGTGVVHSEMNPFNETAHLLQIWITPEENNLTPGWWEKSFDSSKPLDVIVEPMVKTNQISSLNSSIFGNGLQMARNGYILKISQDAVLDFNKFGSSFVYLHQAKGSSTLELEGKSYSLEVGDAANHEINNNLNIKTDNGILLAFIFPNVIL